MTDPDDHASKERERRNANIVLLVFFVVLIGIGVLLVDALLRARRADDCIAQGRRNCSAPIERPAN